MIHLSLMGRGVTGRTVGIISVSTHTLQYVLRALRGAVSNYSAALGCTSLRWAACRLLPSKHENRPLIMENGGR
jgi:hypothetical protein